MKILGTKKDVNIHKRNNHLLLQSSYACAKHLHELDKNHFGVERISVSDMIKYGRSQKM